MLAKQITVCISPALGKRVRKRALAKGCSQSEIVRDALENYLGSILMRGFAYELALAAGLIGRLQGVPIDLSSNRKYLKGFGKQR